MNRKSNPTDELKVQIAHLIMESEPFSTAIKVIVGTADFLGSEFSTLTGLTDKKTGESKYFRITISHITEKEFEEHEGYRK